MHHKPSASQAKTFATVACALYQDSSLSFIRLKTLQMKMPVELLLCYLLHTADYGMLCCIYLLSTVLRLSSYNHTATKARKTMKTRYIFSQNVRQVRPIFCRTPDRFRASENAGQSGIFRTGPKSGSSLFRTTST